MVNKFTWFVVKTPTDKGWRVTADQFVTKSDQLLHDASKYSNPERQAKRIAKQVSEQIGIPVMDWDRDRFIG
ncbi:hypothetical protein [Brevibacillus migulae]|uniref:hypothetical protein n=1 Tax=Brevibacillus migulae TaxID=1644114 RepID=UPI00106E57EF|nr:hypothetical protein [Brevibacillus migulae]